MADYQRINVKQEWYDEVSDFLRDNPEEGFEPEEVKQFIKFCTRKFMRGDNKGLDSDNLEKRLSDIESKLD